MVDVDRVVVDVVLGADGVPVAVLRCPPEEQPDRSRDEHADARVASRAARLIPDFMSALAIR